MLGIYFGAAELCVSCFYNGQPRTVLRIPAYVTVTEVGEILAGYRAIRYRKCHADAPVYSAMEVMRQGAWKKTAKIFYRGIEVYGLRMCDCLLQELRRELDRTAYGKSRECVMAVPSFSFLYAEYLKGLMERAGFVVKRMLSASVACSTFVAFKAGLCEQSEPIYVYACAVSRYTLEFSLAECAEGIEEILGEFEHPLEKKELRADEIVGTARQVVKGEWVWSPGEADKINSYVFAEGRTLPGDGQVGDLCGCAAAGCAIQGANLTARIDKDFLLLDVTPTAYGLEVLRADDGQPLQELQWLIKEHATLPTLKRFEYDSRKTGKGAREKLKLYIGDSSKGSLSETVEVSLDDHRPFLERGVIELGVDIDFRSKIGVQLFDPATNEKEYIPISLTATRRPLPERNRKIDQRRLLKAVWKEMRKLRQAMDRTPSRELNSPTRKGLEQIERKCAGFLDKRGLSYAAFPEYVAAEDTAGMLGELLEIVDSLEYGLRGYAGGEPQVTDHVMAWIYLGFQEILGEYAHLLPVEAEGCIFDVKCHQAAAHETNAGLESSLVIEEMQKGYYWGEQLFRPAIVKVAN